jgi:hypothetical protein
MADEEKRDGEARCLQLCRSKAKQSGGAKLKNSHTKQHDIVHHRQQHWHIL